MARLGDDEVEVGVLDVAGRCSPRRGVVQADDRGAREGRAAEGEQVVGRVVEQHPDVERPSSPAGRAACCEEEVRPADRLGGELRVGPHLVAEPDRRAVADRRGDAPLRRSSAAASGAGIGA